MANTNVAVDGFSYKPLNNEKTLVPKSLDESVYKSICQNTNAVKEDFLPIYIINSHDGFSNNNTAKREKLVRIVCRLVLGSLLAIWIIFLALLLAREATLFVYRPEASLINSIAKQISSDYDRGRYEYK